ncbi:BolA family protein [Candidatus Raskinella chloraquaticus]
MAGVAAKGKTGHRSGGQYTKGRSPVIDVADSLGNGPLMTRAERLHDILTGGFQPAFLEIIDESALHAGHAGAGSGGETHYRVTLVTPVFGGLSRVERHRRVNAALAGEFAQGLHALALSLKAPGE